MARRFRLEIVTPEEIAFSDEIVSLVVPAYEGYLGVLAAHAPLLCQLKRGIITIKTEESELKFSTLGGFMEVTPQKTTILCESLNQL
jgi:F-type H+-transporting ATPase subunit epsilon